MASVEKRLGKLEEQSKASEDGLQAWARDEFYRRLTLEELKWLLGPADEAASLVPCPHVELVKCGCGGDERRRRGLEAHPRLREEFARRWGILYERREEILAREPEDPAASRGGRHGIGA